MANHSSILAWRIPKDRGAWRATVHGVAKNWTQLSDWAHKVYRPLQTAAEYTFSSRSYELNDCLPYQLTQAVAAIKSPHYKAAPTPRSLEGTQAGKKECQLLQSPQHFTLRRLRMIKHKVLAIDSWSAYQRKGFSKHRLLHLSTYSKMLNSLIWDNCFFFTTVIFWCSDHLDFCCKNSYISWLFRTVIWDAVSGAWSPQNICWIKIKLSAFFFQLIVTWNIYQDRPHSQP